MQARTGADIRQYESGWRLEKWVEAQLDPAGDLWPAWWLRLELPKVGGSLAVIQRLARIFYS
jgi:hypothetical protein